jgi:hypothetical protein
LSRMSGGRGRQHDYVDGWVFEHLLVCPITSAPEVRCETVCSSSACDASKLGFGDNSCCDIGPFAAHVSRAQDSDPDAHGFTIAQSEKPYESSAVVSKSPSIGPIPLYLWVKQNLHVLKQRDSIRRGGPVLRSGPGAWLARRTRCWLFAC